MHVITHRHNPELLQKTKQQADEIVEILYENVSKVMERQEKLEDLNYNAETLEKQASVFKKQAVDVKRKKKWANVKTKIVTGIVILVFVLLIIGKKYM